MIELRWVEGEASGPGASRDDERMIVASSNQRVMYMRMSRTHTVILSANEVIDEFIIDEENNL